MQILISYIYIYTWGFASVATDMFQRWWPVVSFLQRYLLCLQVETTCSLQETRCWPAVFSECCKVDGSLTHVLSPIQNGSLKLLRNADGRTEGILARPQVSPGNRGEVFADFFWRPPLDGHKRSASISIAFKNLSPYLFTRYQYGSAECLAWPLRVLLLHYTTYIMKKDVLADQALEGLTY